jgi:hypothetical protein
MFATFTNRYSYNTRAKSSINLNSDRLIPSYRVILSTDGHVHLGVPIGQPEFIEQRLRTQLESRVLDPDRIPLDHPEAIFRLVSLCINPSVIYYRRAAGYSHAQLSLRHFDESIEHLLRRVLELPVQPLHIHGQRQDDALNRTDPASLSYRFSRLLRMPRALGGLGVYAHYGMEGERSELVVRLRIYNFIRTHNFLTLCQFPNPNTQDDIRIGRSEDIEDYLAQHTQLTADGDNFYLHMRSSTVASLTRKAISDVHRARLLDLLRHLQSHTATHLYAAYLRSATEDAGSGPLAWIKGFYGNDMPYFKEVIQLYLGLPSLPTQVPGGIRGYRCACQFDRHCRTESSDIDPCTSSGFGHSLRCGRMSARKTKRHELVKTGLVKLIKDRVTGHDVRADIVVKDPAGRLLHVIDVAVVTPATTDYIKRTVRAHELKDAAAIHEEHRKASIYDAAGIPSTLFIPFVLEATGRLGPSAKTFLRGLCGSHTYRRSQFIAECSWKLAVCAGQMIRLSRQYLAPYA